METSGRERLAENLPEVRTRLFVSDEAQQKFNAFTKSKSDTSVNE